MESIRILQNTYEKLYALSKPLAGFLQDRLPCISPNWKRECVDGVLEEKINFSNDRIFEQLDVYYLLVILLDKENWSRLKNVFPNDSFFTKENYDDLRKVRDIRNIISHPQIRNYSLEEFNKWDNQIRYAAIIFNTDLNTLIADLHKVEKKTNPKNHYRQCYYPSTGAS